MNGCFVCVCMWSTSDLFVHVAGQKHAAASRRCGRRNSCAALTLHLSIRSNRTPGARAAIAWLLRVSAVFTHHFWSLPATWKYLGCHHIVSISSRGLPVFSVPGVYVTLPSPHGSVRFTPLFLSREVLDEAVSDMQVDICGSHLLHHSHQ